MKKVIIFSGGDIQVYSSDRTRRLDLERTGGPSEDGEGSRFMSFSLYTKDDATDSWQCREGTPMITAIRSGSRESLKIRAACFFLEEIETTLDTGGSLSDRMRDLSVIDSRDSIWERVQISEVEREYMV